MKNSKDKAKKDSVPCRAIYDKKGRPILPGDTLKIFHFRCALRREIRYMYRYVTGYYGDNALEISHLNPNGGNYFILLDGSVKGDIEIVQGYAGVKPGDDFHDRKRINIREGI